MKNMLKKLLTGILRRTAKSSALEQHFIEHGSTQEFKRCVLERVEDCRVKQLAFWGTFSSGVQYNVGQVVYNAQTGAMIVMTNDGPTEIVSPTETTFAFTGTCTGAWNDGLLQEVPSISSRNKRETTYAWAVDFDQAHSLVSRP
jgi:hypothetical protein